MGTKNGKWDGKGTPPSLRAAAEWLASHTGMMPNVATAQLRDLPPSQRGVVARELAGPDATERPAGKPPVVPKKNPPRKAVKPAAAKNDAMTITVGADGALSATNADGDAVEGDDLLSLIAQGPGAAGSDRGVPIWPYETSSLTDAQLEGLNVMDRSKKPGSVNGVVPKNGRVGARYFGSSALAPLGWTPEKRADVQRQMHALGLYGDKKVRLGDWTLDDQRAFGDVLGQSNVNGLRWKEMLDEWKRTGAPPDVLAAARGDRPARPTIQVTNPIDIRKAATETSRELTGAVDPGFAESVVKPYQASEAGAQGAVYGDQDSGGGGTVTREAAMGNFAEDKLRREKPLEVDGYQFLNQFQGFLSMIGAS